MPNKCCVPLCNGNYDNGPKVCSFSFPSEENLVRDWLQAIKRENFKPTKYSRVCELHFRPEDIKWETSFCSDKSGAKLKAKLKIPRLRKGVVPLTRPRCPSYLALPEVPGSELPEGRGAREEEVTVQESLKQSIAEHQELKESRTFGNLGELVQKLKHLDKYWNIIERENSVVVCHVTDNPDPKIKCAVTISDSSRVKVFFESVELQELGHYKIPSEINNTDLLEEILCNLREYDFEQHKSSSTCPGRSKFIFLVQLVISILIQLQETTSKYRDNLKVICEQLHLMTLKRPSYSPELMVFSSLMYHCSPKGYRLLRNTGYLILPCNSTVCLLSPPRMTPVPEQQNCHFLSYINKKFKFLTQNDMTVSLMIDEIHIDDKGGRVVGSASDCNEAARSAVVFMINSVCSGFKDVVRILAARTLKPEVLFTFIKNIVTGLEKIGFRVISVVAANNTISKEAMSLFANPPQLSIVYRHPSLKSRPLFFLFDAAHLLKCVRDDWLHQTDSERTMKFPHFSIDGFTHTNVTCTAPFNTLNKLHFLEANSLLKQACKLTLNSLCPSRLEKQNVTLALQIFNDGVAEALRSAGKKHSLPSFGHVANYITIFNTWWGIMNVNSPSKAKCLNEYVTPLTNDSSDKSFVFLNKFSAWLDRWDSMREIGGKLMRETFKALKHTTKAMVELTSYCNNELGINSILTARFQKVELETRFSQYRQLTGCSYNISGQIVKCEKQMQIPMLSLPFKNKNITLSEFKDISWDNIDLDSISSEEMFNVDVTKDDVEKSLDVLSALTYLARYCCSSVLKKMKCDSCKNILTINSSVTNPPDYHCIQVTSKGSLLNPDEYVVKIIIYNYIVINKLTEMPDFCHSLKQRAMATQVTLNVVAENDALLPLETCQNNHSIEQLEKLLVWASTNSLLNSAEESNLGNKNKNRGKKRKMQTLL